jgi:(p)ppGpp synthase/HD superfamily hydrolase
MSDSTDTPKLGSAFDAALFLASELHRTQLRKSSSVPYVSHLLSVAALVLEDGGDEAEAIAALLHDALEDAPDQITAEEIAQRFGSKVRDILACTDAPHDYAGGEKPEWQARKSAYLAHIASRTVPYGVSLADKVHNARSILRDRLVEGEAVWDRFTATREQTLWYYRGLSAAYREAGASGFLIDELERIVGELEAMARRLERRAAVPGARSAPRR